MDETRNGMTDLGYKRHLPVVVSAPFPTFALCGGRLTISLLPGSPEMTTVLPCKRCKAVGVEGQVA